MKKFLIIFFAFFLAVGGSATPAPGEDEINLADLLEGGKIISPAGLFDTGKVEFNPQLAHFLDSLGDFLKKKPGLVIEIGGHTDNSGTPERNRKLSLARARRVQDYLVEKSGIQKNSILVKGYSSGFPIGDNRTPGGRARNRRVEIVSVKNSDPAGRLTYIRRVVLTKSPGIPEFSRAILNQGLFHLDRVLTRQKSNANVTFQDLSKISLGPQSLMIMYSLIEKGFQLPRKQNVSLLTGGLRTKLNKLKGALQVETPSCVINSNSIEILVGIDRKKMSALSVYDGKSEVNAQGETVEVPGGYGTVVEMGEPPAPPEPLPPAPQLIEPLAAEIHLPQRSDTATVRFQWSLSEDSYHLQVAVDSQFEKITEDQVVEGNTAALALGPGTHYWRVAAINKRGLEGFSSHSSFTILDLPPGLPIEITPSPGQFISTSNRNITVSGKTLPGARITVGGQQFSVNPEGTFSVAVSLKSGLNDIEIRVWHPDYREKRLWFTAYRYYLGESAWRVGFFFHYETGGDSLEPAFALQVGKTFRLAPRFEAEFSTGLTKWLWKDSPGDFKKSTLAIPLTAELHLLLGRGAVKPYLSSGITAYFAFPRKSEGDTGEAALFISPEIGGGLAFPVLGTTTRAEIKYAPLLKKEPFLRETAHRIAFVLKLTLY